MMNFGFSKKINYFLPLIRKKFQKIYKYEENKINAFLLIFGRTDRSGT